MLILLFMTLLAFGAYVCLVRYEHRLARKAGPWIATMIGSDETGKRHPR